MNVPPFLSPLDRVRIERDLALPILALALLAEERHGGLRIGPIDHGLDQVLLVHDVRVAGLALREAAVRLPRRA